MEENGTYLMDKLLPVVVENSISFYRDKDGNEIDLSIQAKSTLYPLEIRPYSETQRSFDLLEQIPGIQRGFDGMICPWGAFISLREADKGIPVGVPVAEGRM